MKRDLSYVEKSEALSKFIDFCHSHLFDPHSEQVLSYLMNERKLSLETIKKFKLGAFPRYAQVIANNLGAFTSWKCGLTRFNSDGAVVSKFSTHKVIIPVYDQHSNPIAIMGRAMLSSAALEARGLPKYTNTPYRKSKSLFGLNFGKDVIRERNEIIIVEGNFDVITAHQFGIRNVVAVSNANLSKYQLVLAARYARNLVLMLDNDNAGREGADRAVKLFGHLKDIDLGSIRLPDNTKDIDDFLKAGYLLESIR